MKAREVNIADIGLSNVREDGSVFELRRPRHGCNDIVLSGINGAPHVELGARGIQQHGNGLLIPNGSGVRMNGKIYFNQDGRVVGHMPIAAISAEPDKNAWHRPGRRCARATLQVAKSH